jgi:hypothetical protein
MDQQTVGRLRIAHTFVPEKHALTRPRRPVLRARKEEVNLDAAVHGARMRARKEEVREQNNLDAAVHGARMIVPANASCQWKGTGLRRFKRRGVRAKFSFARTE